MAESDMFLKIEDNYIKNLTSIIFCTQKTATIIGGRTSVRQRKQAELEMENCPVYFLANYSLFQIHKDFFSSYLYNIKNN